jgi:hypothetical protein
MSCGSRDKYTRSLTIITSSCGQKRAQRGEEVVVAVDEEMREEKAVVWGGC